MPKLTHLLSLACGAKLAGNKCRIRFRSGEVKGMTYRRCLSGWEVATTLSLWRTRLGMADGPGCHGSCVWRVCVVPADHSRITHHARVFDVR